MNIDIAATTVSLLTLFGIYAIVALSLNLQYGLGGIPNFGIALFVSIGAYTAGVTYTRLMPLLAGKDALNPCGATNMAQALALRTEILKTMPAAALGNFALTLVIAAVLGGLIGLLASFPALRLKEEWFLGLVLLVAAETARIFVRGFEPIICAHNGLSGIAPPLGWLPTAQVRQYAFLALILVILAVVYIYAERLARSPYGRVLKALRENNAVASGLGKPMARVRGQVMIIGSALAAIAGVLFVMNVGFASANDYAVPLTLDIWVMVVLGGLGNMRGALLGALIVTVLDRFTSIAAIQLNMLGLDLEFNYVRYILFGVILLLMLRYRPQGLLPEPIRTTKAGSAMAAIQARQQGNGQDVAGSEIGT
ncbi:MAG: branched-chain amino acid ABC transporter permease [Anaerolineales bacterium]|nr:branched-chain amino acid ABC transporter permease [Anaerolineales bacterium]